MKTSNIEKVKRARQDVIDSIASTYSSELFGVPPSSSESGKLKGGTPPNMELIQRLFK